MEIDGDDTSLGGNTSPLVKNEKKRPTQYVYWSFTYNNYNIETLETIFTILKHECDWYIIQEETGESGNKHLQGTLKLKKKKRLLELLKLCKGPHYEPTICVTASAAYCSKEDKRTGDIWTHNFDIPEKIINTFKPYGWQLEVLNIISKPVPEDDRIINWFWENQGGVGKSILATWLFDYKHAMLCQGKTNDIYHLMTQFPDRRKIFIFDTTMETMEFFRYSTIEQIKNGIVISGKYNGKIMRYNRPHVFVFANIPPDQSKMTKNKRWNIVDLRTRIQNQT